MPWLEKQWVVKLLSDLGAKYQELQLHFTWYGRATFKGESANVHCDFTLVGASSIRREGLIIKSQYKGAGSEFSEIARITRKDAENKFEKELLACKAALNINRKLDGQQAERYAYEIIPITSTWSVAKIKMRSDKFYGLETRESYLVRNGLIVSLPPSFQ